MTKQNIDFGQAEQKAKKRDLEIEKQQFIEEHNGVDQGEVDEALKILSWATGGKEVYIGTKKSPQSKVRFAQFLQKNWEFLRSEKYFTSEEKVFLVDIQSNISMHSNAIVDDITKKPANTLTIQALANYLNTSRTKISRIVNTLIKKGIIAKAVTGDIKNFNQAKDYVLFINPNIICVGDKDDIGEHLVLMFKKQMESNPILKKLPQKLF
ncbi:MarR family transcriptional regulator [Bacillus thuringiensis]|uniref:helix-turn-helix domain-containing protein n=1 Tax=Bacillus thuringiensis TaxID=1428 RepID=UPI000BF6D45D|nr:helix-turn-helix domain-containing protein [Bacillus thuringiensis]PFB49370.1 MarR family transcriptional regulator [Bacillus thuringiensis]PFE98751.1 MarR family transcriptional regulator [Bacillus thuringiensis]